LVQIETFSGTMKKLAIIGASIFVDRMFEACGNYQWARKRPKNSLEAKLRKSNLASSGKLSKNRESTDALSRICYQRQGLSQPGRQERLTYNTVRAALTALARSLWPRNNASFCGNLIRPLGTPRETALRASVPTCGREPVVELELPHLDVGPNFRDGNFGGMACTHKSSLLSAACSVSALPLIATGQRTFREVRKVPNPNFWMKASPSQIRT
jgi:hypothetical protein